MTHARRSGLDLMTHTSDRVHLQHLQAIGNYFTEIINIVMMLVDCVFLSNLQERRFVRGFYIANSPVPVDRI